MNPITLTRAARAIWGRRAPITAVGASVLILMSQSPFAATVAQAQSSQPITQNDANTSVHDHWMADMPGGFGRLKLGQVILPASHDSGTYAFLDDWAASNVAPAYATTQDIDVYTQLQHGVRVLDLRGRNFSGGATLWAGLTPGIADVTKQLPQDYYVYHGQETSDLPLATVLDDVASWVLAPGHDKEVVIVQVAIDGEKTQRLTDMCNSFNQQVGPVLLKPDTFNAARVSYTGPDIAQNTLTDVWSLPGHQRVILNWDGCGPNWPTGTFNGYWANQCYAKSYNSVAFDRPGIIGALQTALNGRLSALGGDGLQGGSGQIDTRPSTMPGSPPAGTISTTAGSVAPGSYAVKYAWLSPLGETRASPEGNVVVPEGSDTNTISFSLPPFPPGVTGAAIYMSSVGSSVVTRQGQIEPRPDTPPGLPPTYHQTVPPTTTGQSPTNSDQVGYMRDSYGRTVLNGFYTLGMHASITGECAFPMDWFLPQQVMVLDTVKGWFDSSQNHARDYLNIVSADLVEKSKLVDYAIQMNTPKG